jgi:hypothetical protein
MTEPFLIEGKMKASGYNSYYAAPWDEYCVCGRCSAWTPQVPCTIRGGVTDPQIGWQTCCGGFCKQQKICGAPLSSDCNIGRSSKGENPVINIVWNEAPPNITCIYDLNKIDTVSQAISFHNKFGSNNDVLNKICFQKVNKCGNSETECSRIKSVADGSNLCKLWFENQPMPNQNALMQDYCIKNKTRECDCVLRSDNKTYTLMKGMHVYNDGCWFLPCADSSKFFVPGDLQHPVCPSNICQTVIDVANANNVDIDNIKSDINCQFGPAPGPNIWDQIIEYIKKHKILVGISVIFVVTAVVVLIALLSRKTKYN